MPCNNPYTPSMHRHHVKIKRHWLHMGQEAVKLQGGRPLSSSLPFLPHPPSVLTSRFSRVFTPMLRRPFKPVNPDHTHSGFPSKKTFSCAR